MNRRHSQPDRHVRASATLPEILLFVEGEATEKRYFEHWARQYRHYVKLTIGERTGSPRFLMERARKAKEYNARQVKRGRGQPYHQIWCVFDVDEHPGVDGVLQQGQAIGIHVAVSNPCIELWFILHVQDQTAHIDRHSVQALAYELLGCGKNLSQEALEQLAASCEDAKRRAQELDSKHEGDGSPPGSNPSSGVWRLIDSLREAAGH